MSRNIATDQNYQRFSLSPDKQAINHCNSFIVLIGREGVGRWVGAETQVSLNRYFSSHDDAKRLPIFLIPLGDCKPDTLPAFLQLLQATSWNSSEPLSDALLEQISNRAIVANKVSSFSGKPFVGLFAYRVDQAPLFLGRQQQTLDVLYFFGPCPGLAVVRWLKISGSSGSEKSSLMNAGLLPLIDNSWLFSRTGYSHWLRIRPKTSGEHDGNDARTKATGTASAAMETAQTHETIVRTRRLVGFD